MKKKDSERNLDDLKGFEVLSEDEMAKIRGGVPLTELQFSQLSGDELSRLCGGVYPGEYFDERFDNDISSDVFNWTDHVMGVTLNDAPWNDENRFFLMPDGGVQLCPFESRYRMEWDYGRDVHPVRLSDLGAFSILSSQMMKSYGKQTGFTTECDCIVHAPFHDGLVRDFKTNLNGLHIRVADKDNMRKTIETVHIDSRRTLPAADLRILAACMWDNMDAMMYQGVCKGMNRQAGLNDGTVKDRIRKAYRRMCSSKKNGKSKAQKI